MRKSISSFAVLIVAAIMTATTGSAAKLAAHLQNMANNPPSTNWQSVNNLIKDQLKVLARRHNMG